MEFAIKKNDSQMINKLISLGADSYFKDSEDFSHLKDEEAKKRLSFQLDVQIMPILKGCLFKHSTLMRMHKRRYFVLNPNLGLLTRYKRDYDYPFKPK